MALTLDNSYFIVLGASIDQKISIITANRLGFKTLVFDKNPDAECKNYASKFFSCSSTDFNNIKKKIKKYKNEIKGVIAQGSDIPKTVSKIEKYLKIKDRVPLKSAIICTDKKLMKDFFIKKKIPTPKQYYNIRSIKKIKFPVVVKPVDMSGAKGVFLCANKDEVDKFYKKSKNISIKKKVIIEEFYKGPQLSTETLIINKKCFTIGFAERNYKDTLSFYPNILENGGIQPAQKFIKYKDSINKSIMQIAKGLNINNGVIKSDIVLKNKNFFFIEIALRLSGGDFSETLIPKSTGVNIIKCAIKNAAGLKVNDHELKEKKNKLFIANRYFFSDRDINLNKKLSIKKIKNYKWLEKIQLNKSKKISRTRSHRDRFGVFIVSAQSISSLNRRIKIIYSKFKFNVRKYT